MSSEQVLNYIKGQWIGGTEEGRFDVLNPATGEVIGWGSSDGLDLGEAVRWGREVGGANLRAMSFGQRAAMLGKMSKVLLEGPGRR